jgi:hypothetical protein
MRIRSTLTGLAVAAGVLLLGAPAVLAQQPTLPPSPVPATSTTKSPQLPTRSTIAPPAPSVREKMERPGQVVKPRGAADTGGGGTSNDQGLYAIGGAALVLTGGAGALAYRRFRKQS